MHITLHPVSREEKHILGNLLEKYLYEFSQYELMTFNEEGLFGYSYLGSTEKAKSHNKNAWMRNTGNKKGEKR